MASDEVWGQLKHFDKNSDTDNWGDVDAISDELLLKLDDFRDYIGVPVLVLWGTGGKHSSRSYHYVERGACAVDVAIPNYRATPIDLLIDVFRFNFRGVGFYPDWVYHGKQAKGLHLDTRPYMWDVDGTKNFRESRWIGVRGAQGQEYMSLSWDNINKHTKGNKWK